MFFDRNERPVIFVIFEFLEYFECREYFECFDSFDTFELSDLVSILWLNSTMPFYVPVFLYVKVDFFVIYIIPWFDKWFDKVGVFGRPPYVGVKSVSCVPGSL